MVTTAHHPAHVQRSFPMWILFLAQLLVVTRGTAELGEKKIDVDIGRCRSRCVFKYVSNPPNNDKCEESECKPCWKTCYYIYREYNVWKEMCPMPVVCGKGCRFACKFQGTASDATNPMNAKFVIAPKIVPQILRKSRKVRYSISWTVPVYNDGKVAENNTIYSLMKRHWKPRPSGQYPWVVIAQTITPELTFNVRSRGPDLDEFKLLAITEKGKIAVANFKPKIEAPLNMQEAKDGYRFDNKTSPSNDSKSHTIVDVPVILTKPPPLKLNLTQTMTTDNGTIRMILVWPAVADMFTVAWGLLSCKAYKDLPLPECDKPPDFYSVLVWKKEKNQQQIIFSLEGLMFNSHYFLDIIPDEKSGYEMVDHMDIYTPVCHLLDETFTRCYTMQDSADTPTYSWPLHGDLSYDPTIHKVVAKVSWDDPFNYTGKYQIFWQEWKFSDDNETKGTAEGFAANIDETELSNATIRLEPNRAYIIEAKTSEQIDIGDGRLRYLFSQKLRLNTTDGDVRIAAAPSFGTVHPAKQQKVEPSSTNVIAIAVVSALGIFMLIGGIIFWRKCRSGTAIEKKVVANCNSYKSAFGEDKNRDRMDPLLTVRDEWELDHCDIKFGSVLGQGAFGKVMTGIYDEQKVAIKVLKDNAPLSYREDFIAEITLMKKLGVHQHIVSLIGACTIAEPLALVLEYMPHGNLQNFLRKCRLEGYIHQNAEGIQELQYRELTESGSDITWNITPSDMLSFARQVALAMEYIADKQFVHRDLAARNVLVGSDKLVKLCDFGLSRDVYGTCEYHKITSGKLPLKWMALESLRDRIFTIQSDVWSFGILLWEIVTMGGSPYPSIALADLYVVLCNGYRMESPSNCSTEVYDIMHRCWAEDPADRPTFTALRESLELLLGRELNYLQLDNIDVPIHPASNSSDLAQPGCLTVDNLELIPFADRDIETTPLTDSVEVLTLPEGDLGLLSSSHTSGYLEAKPSGYLEAKPCLGLMGLNGLSQGMFSDVV